MRGFASIVLVCGLLLACSEEDTALFSKLDKDDTGIDFTNTNHETERSNIFTYEYFYNGGGVAIGDVNNDGLADIYFTSNIFSNKLYLNEGDFKFRDITESSGTGCEVGWKTGVTMVDVNADGLLDIYVSRSASPDPERRRNILLINNGDLTFTDKARDYHLDDPSYSTHAAFFDFDRDNDLDAITLNHSLLEISNVLNLTLKNSDIRYPNVGNRFYRNDGGKFIDVSDSIGVYGSAFNYGLGVSLSDIDNDGWIDMYTGCDYTARDKLLINDEGKSFKDVTADQLDHISKFTMGTDIADINGDGFMDIITLDMLPEDNRRQKQLMGADRYDVFNRMVKSGLHAQYMRNMLHLNNGNGTFSEIGQVAGISNTDWSWAPLFADFDNDGVMDLFVSNGFKRDLTDNDFTKYTAFQGIVDARRQGKEVSFLEVISKFKENKIPNYMFRGNGDLTFSDATKDWGFDHATLTNGAAYGDLDNDGDLDLVTNNVNEEAGIYRNNAEKTQHHFLKVELGKNGNNAFALGGKVTLVLGDKRVVRELLPVRGFQSSVDPVLHFGLGSSTTIDTVIVEWPSGERRFLTKVTADKRITISPNDGTVYPRTEAKAHTLFTASHKAPAFIHTENEFIDFREQALLPRMYSTLGPAMATADVNGDGLTDIYVGGAKGQSGALFFKTKAAGYIRNAQPLFDQDKMSEDVAASFFDVDSDGDQDLFVGSGGYEFAAGDSAFRDRLYKNDGKGNFTKIPLPDYLTSTSCVKPGDVDGDGDPDVFVGARIIPGRYPETPNSYLLINDGKGNFIVDDGNNELSNAGMVTDAEWVDLNKDDQSDLVVVGEWMPIRVFINENGKFSDQSGKWSGANTEGFWNAILAEDFDLDGDLDLVVSNLGLNTQMKVTEDRPATLYYDDFDKNGSVDPILNYYVMGKSYPYPSRDELTEQVPSFKKRFTSYGSYSDATIENVLTSEEISNVRKLTVHEVRSCYLQNDGTRFSMKSMPIQFQFAPAFAMAAMDVNDDGRADIISGGNLSATRSRTGKLSGNTGFIYLNRGGGNFEFVPPSSTGIRLTGDVRQIETDGGRVIIGINNDRVDAYDLNR